jgi:hypothetical protein
LDSRNLYVAGQSRSSGAGTLAAVLAVPLLLAEVHPAAPAPAPQGSVLPWLLAAAVLAVIVAGGVYLTSRH